jgi:hypothetical protein
VATGSERYRQHPVWETLKLKRDALDAARYDVAASEQWRMDIVEWLDEAEKTKEALQPALYLSALDALSNALNSLPTDANQFKQYVSNRQQNQPQSVSGLEAALRALPLPPVQELNDSFIALLDREVEARTTRLDELESQVADTEASLQKRLDELNRVSGEVERLSNEIREQRDAIAAVGESAKTSIREEWEEAFAAWKKDRSAADEARDAEGVEHVTALAAIRRAAEVLAEHAGGDLTAADWSRRSKRERKAAQWIRFGAMVAFVFAGAVGVFIVSEAIRSGFDLTIGDGVLRSSVAIVIAAFGALLLREANRHFKEADTSEDVVLSMRALAPFYSGSDDTVRVAAREKVGDAVLVKNVLSRFANRDATKHSSAELESLVKDGTNALKPGSDGDV